MYGIGRHSKIKNYDELNKRYQEVFMANKRDIVYDIRVRGDGQLEIDMDEATDKDTFEWIVYSPNMEERPQALAYLMGDRNDFND